MLGLLALALTGCREGPGDSQESHAASYQRQLDSSGKRIMVLDAAGEPVAKLRERRSKYKVYDKELMPLGFVSWQKTAGDDAAATTVSVRALDSKEQPSIVARSDNTFELASRFRIERTDRGWAVFGPSAELVGAFEQDEAGDWQLRKNYGDGEVIEVEKAGNGWALIDDDATRLEVKTGELSSLQVLAMALDDLSLLDRVAVGVWMTEARPRDGA